MHRDHIHNGNIAQPVVGRKTWFLLPPWVGPWACVVHNNISKVGFSKARHPGHREYWEEVREVQVLLAGRALAGKMVFGALTHSGARVAGLPVVGERH